MQNRRAFLFLFLLLMVVTVAAQQVADLDYKPPIHKPAYAQDAGPRVVIDAAHHNFHTVDGRYKPFAELLRRDGYRVTGSNAPFTADSLKSADVLVIANALNEVNALDEVHQTMNWALPTPPAFSADEVAAVKKWVENGGSLFLIIDHMPFPGAAGDLARAFGVEFSNGFAMPRDAKNPGPITFTPETGLEPGPWTTGRSPEERVDSIVTFTGSAFYPGPNVQPVLMFPDGYISVTPEVAWQFTPTMPKIPIKGWCQGAVEQFGNGRVAIFGEAGMFSAQLAGPQKHPMGMNAPGAKQNYQFLLNIVHWLSHAD